jgi:ribonucleoside-diphosphate reductase alpha chain
MSIKPRSRARILPGKTITKRTQCGNIYVTINRDPEGMFETFTQIGKSGSCVKAWAEGVSRLISLALRSGCDKKDIVKQLRKIECPSRMETDGKTVFSCPDAIAQAIEEAEA